MRKLFALVAVLLGCLLFAGQTVAAATAGYSDCCLHGCEGMAQCTSASCQACATPLAAPVADAAALLLPQARAWSPIAVPTRAGPTREPWNPPD